MRPSKWLVFIRSQLAGFDRSLTITHCSVDQEPLIGISAVEIHPRQRQVKVRLHFGFIVRLEDSLRLMLVARFEAGLMTGDFMFEVEDAPGTPDQTECFLHYFTHGYECAGIGDCRVSEQWACGSRALVHKTTKEISKYWRQKRERRQSPLTSSADQGSEIRKKRCGGVAVTGT
jgi:hypothetical protein